ncbi:MAG: Fe-S cluster assembly sulfur transfer protein SufU [Lachnospiraceae bacterium]
MEMNELYTDIVKEYSMSKHNQHNLADASIRVPGKNPSCGDEIELELKIDDGIVVDAAFTGIGCAISRASVTIMIDLIKGKSVPEAKELADIFLKMATREDVCETDLEKLEDAAALQGVSNMPARVKCATMPWHTLCKALEE